MTVWQRMVQPKLSLMFNILLSLRISQEMVIFASKSDVSEDFDTFNQCEADCEIWRE